MDGIIVEGLLVLGQTRRYMFDFSFEYGPLVKQKRRVL